MFFRANHNIIVLVRSLMVEQYSSYLNVLSYAIKNKMTIYDIRDTVHVFPTLSEMIKKVAQSFDQNINDMACCIE